MRNLAKRIAFTIDALARRPGVRARPVDPSVLLVLAASMVLCAGLRAAADKTYDPELLVRMPGDDAADSSPASFHQTDAQRRTEAIRRPSRNVAASVLS
jgi:hypothetical protein